MKKVLVVAYYFPPHQIAASLRPRGLARYLPEWGWEAVVLTAAAPGRTRGEAGVVETERRESRALGMGRRLFGLDPEQTLMAQIAGLKKKLRIRSERSALDLVLVAMGEVAAYPDPQKGWRGHAVQAGHDILCQDDFRAMISMGPPATVHVVARELKERWGVPWVADFRDLWTQNYYYPYSPLRRRVERRLELRTLGPADALVATSPPMAGDLGGLHGQKPVFSIPNGFDPGEVNTGQGRLTEKFTITYTGNLYPGRQSPEPLFAALGELIWEGTMEAGDVEVRFYGAEAGWVDKKAERYGLRHIVRQFGSVPRESALERQRESQILLLLRWNDAGQRGVYTAKVFEYLAARRPVLAVGGFPDVVDELLDETGAGVSGQTWLDVKALLRGLYEEYKSSGAVGYGGDAAVIDKYSHREMARRFAGVLDRISCTPSGRSLSQGQSVPRP